MKKLVIATRGSKLALWQANHIKRLLVDRHQNQVTVELLPIKTTGDKILDSPLAAIGGKGLFVKEIEEALLDGRADLAVHSMKDVPVKLPAGLTLGVIPEREDPSDTLLSVDYPSLDALPTGAKVGTSSLRRQAQLLALRPDLTVESLRGNVDTRLRKLIEGQYAAIVMATSGMNRLGLSAPVMEKLSPPRFLPAVGQGALGIEYRMGSDGPAEFLGFLNHEPTRICVRAERGFLMGLEGGCQVPIAAYAVLDSPDRLTVRGLVADLTGERIIRRERSGRAAEAHALGLALAEETLAAGGREILDEVYARAGQSAT